MSDVPYQFLILCICLCTKRRPNSSFLSTFSSRLFITYMFFFVFFFYCWVFHVYWTGWMIFSLNIYFIIIMFVLSLDGWSDDGDIVWNWCSIDRFHFNSQRKVFFLFNFKWIFFYWVMESTIHFGMVRTKKSLFIGIIR